MDMPRARLLALLGTCALVLAAPAAHAQPAGAPAVIAAATGGQDDVTRSVLVGAGGQVYEPGDPGTWQRRFGGGVAVDVQGAVRVDADTLFVHGSRAPLFRLQDATWHASPLPNRGRCALDAGAAPVLAIGRHVYTWRGGRWARLASVPGTITAVWAASERQAHAATAQGGLFRVQARKRAEITHPLAAGDVVVQLAGQPRGRLYGLARSGAVLRIGARAATLVGKAPALAGREPHLAAWEPHLAATDASGALWVLGWIPARAEQPAQAVLARAERGTLVPVETLGRLPAQDPFLVFRIDRRGGMLWATQSGAVRYRPAPGDSVPQPGNTSWHDARIVRELPSPASWFPGRAPAHTR